MGVKDSLIGKLLGNTSQFSAEQVEQTIQLLLEHGLKHTATAIHIEPHGKLVWIRYRIHGALHGLHKLPAGALSPLVNALHKKAGLPTDTLTPQEGSFTATLGTRNLTVQVNTMHIVNGERIVLQFAEHESQAQSAASLEQLGFWGANADLVRTTLSHVHGLILVGGLKHSERPAVLYALLHLLRTAAISIGTIEDTIGRRMPGITQMKVLPHDAASYEGALHAPLAQDMNAVMLTDLPSSTVANEAVYAATVGHLVAAGQHSDSAAKGIVHLRHMGVASYMLAAALRLSIGLRSVRRLCLGCRERISLSKEQADRLEQLFGMTTPANRKRIHTLEQQALKAGIGRDLPLSSTPGHLTHAWQASRDGCSDCHHTGFSGVLSLVEVMPGGEYLYAALTDTATTTDIQAAALKQGFVPIALDGMIKALRGETTVAEVVHQGTL